MSRYLTWNSPSDIYPLRDSETEKYSNHAVRVNGQDLKRHSHLQLQLAYYGVIVLQNLLPDTIVIVDPLLVRL